ncbi:class I adenylate-forming enzyme family protein [Jeotgalibacillus haloalkalitolerans]|uniref:Long-chain-fatty-acid--CoA ligase n=1 Tax=Jeotgalibacillus haloalkalitolerans TaxID=3104292 RepID=A0ABU5KJK4_9BACL|nr:long-chain-fatty-acid--CoA ligase [Jeotgalibacillus sp. HH7-29]MDZ5711439.1 long-chain-fatty-acid--CoA ligase [Jeotgalibacillus sp. HH7-29]
MNTSDLLAFQAGKYGSRDAIRFMGKGVTYGELHMKVNQFSQGLKQQGIQKGDKVALFLPNTPEFVIAYLAVQRLDAIVVPVNVKLTAEELAYILDHSDAKALIVHEWVEAAAKDVTSPEIRITTANPDTGWLSFNALFVKSIEEVRSESKEDDESTILYTSGTTGRPKGVLFSYRNIFTVASMIAVEMEVKPESRMLLMMPLSHSAPLHLFMMAGLYVGATLVLTPTFTPELLIETVETEKTTHFFGAPVAYLLTAGHPKLKTADLSSMKWWIYGGAPLSKGEIEKISSAFKTDRLVCVYGLTEAGPSGSLLHAEEHAEKAGSIGRRAPLHTDLKIVNDDGEETAADEVGEIVLAGEGNMLGYYKDPEATAKTMTGHWLRTGDLAKRDQDGYIWVVDRKKDLIISGGVNVYPKEIEEAMLTVPGMREAAVIGVPHPEWGETVKAVFAAENEISQKELLLHLEKKLASFKIPRLIEQVEALPRNASGKILKQVLREAVVK